MLEGAVLLPNLHVGIGAVGREVWGVLRGVPPVHSVAPPKGCLGCPGPEIKYH